jgi:hypothetical protein
MARISKNWDGTVHRQHFDLRSRHFSLLCESEQRGRHHSSYGDAAAAARLPFGFWIPADKSGWWVLWVRTPRNVAWLRFSAFGWLRRRRAAL